MPVFVTINTKFYEGTLSLSVLTAIFRMDLG